MSCKINPLVYGTVRSIAGSLLVAGAFFCFGLTSVHAQTVDASTALTYVIDGNTVTITDCDDSASGALVIPSSYDGKPVTSIGREAFAGCASLTSVTIPASVTTVGNAIFRFCSSLTVIEVDAGNANYSAEDGVLFNKDKTTLVSFGGGKSGSYAVPDTVTSINDSSFESCDTLTSVTIPASVTSIGHGALRGCDALTSIAVSYENAQYTSDNGVLFNKDKTTLITFPGGKSGQYNIPNEVIAIDRESFIFNSGLTSIEIPYSVTSIGDAAFRETGLTEVDIVNSNTVVGDNAFDSSVTVNAALFSTPFTYLVKNNSATITRCETSVSGALVIPSSYNGDPVTSIGDRAFRKCVSLTSVTIPDSVTSIGYEAFLRCSAMESVTIPDSVTVIEGFAFILCESLTSVTIPDSVTTISRGLFSGCTAMESVTIPDSVTVIEAFAFDSCNSLTSVTIPSLVTSLDNVFYHSVGITSIEVNSGNAQYSSEGGVLFNKDKTTLIAYPNGKAGGYTIPSTVTSIASNAFYWSKSLTSVTIPDSVTSIGVDAFDSCESLTSIEIPGSVTRIESEAFHDCVGLTSVTISSGVTTIGWGAFQSCANLTSVTIPDTVTTIEPYAFAGTSLTEVTILNPYTEIGNNAFDSSVTINATFYSAPLTYLLEGGTLTITDCDESASGALVIPSSYNGKPVTSIEWGAFQNCRSLTSVTIPDSVTSIGNSAFQWCSGLTSVTISDSVTSIEDGTFQGCSSLTSVTIGNSVTTIGERAFDGCESLTSVTIPDSVTSIGYLAFQSCINLTSVTFGNSLTRIVSRAFKDCSSLTSITIPESVNRIDAWAFKNCNSLTSVTIPNGVTGIEGGAFAYTPSLTSFELGGDNANYSSVDGILFDKNKTELIQFPSGKSGHYTIPESVTKISNNAFQGCSNLTSVTIPNGVTIIEGFTFVDCISLTSVDIADSVTTIGDRAFMGCTSLTSLLLPESLTSIEINDFESMFPSLTSLTSIEVHPDNTQYSSEDGVLFNKDKTTLIVFPRGKSGPYTIPNTVTAIDQWAFHWCLGLTSIVIPDSVTSIGLAAFSHCEALTSVTIGNSVTSIGESAFDSLLNLTSIVIPDSVTSLGRNAFVLCHSLTSVTIGSSVTSIDDNTFHGCEALTSVTFGNSVTSIGSYAFLGASSLKSVSLPESLITIGSGAFSDTGLESVEIPNSVTSIGDDAFTGSLNLVSVTIPNSVTSIGQKAFAETGLTEVALPNPNTVIGDNAFDSSVNISAALFSAPLTYLVQNNTITVTDCETSASGALEIPSSYNGYPVTSIGVYAFQNCVDLTSVTIPDSVTSIGRGAFSGCSAMVSVTIPDSVTSIGAYAFELCFSLTSVTIPNSVISIDNGAFYDCNSLTSVTIPDSVTSIAFDVFNSCENLTSIEVSSGNAQYSSEDGVLFNKDKTTLVVYPAAKSDLNYTIPDSVTSIGDNAFAYSENLTGVTIPVSVTSIGEAAFRNSQSLTSVTIPNSVTSIGYRSFSGCSSLASITIPDSVTTIEFGAFQDCTGLTAVVIPDSVTKIGAEAFNGCLNLTSVTIPDSVTLIRVGAFTSTGLTTVSIPNPDTVIEAGAFDSSVTIFLGKAPTIDSQETEAATAVGETLVLAIVTSGTSVTHQWSKDGTDIAGATSATLELSGVTGSDAGSYVLKVSNGGGSVESSPIVVSVKTFVIRVNSKLAGATATEVDKALVEIESGKTGWLVYYTLDGSAPENGAEYEVPFELTSGAVIKTIAYPSDFSNELVGPTVDLTVLKSQTLTVVVPTGVAYGAAAVTLVGSASSGLPVTYEVTDGPGKVELGSFEGTSSGVVTLKAHQVGNGTYASVEKSFVVLVNKGVQTVSWTAVDAKTYGDASFDVSASASSGLALTYEVVSGPATIDGVSVTLTGAGTVVLKASQAGDANLNEAEAEVSIAVAKAKQTISFTSLYGTKAFTSDPIQLGGTASSGLSVVYEVIQGEGEVFGADLTLTGVGVVTVRAKQLGNDDYEAASAVDRSVTVEQASQTIEIDVASPVAWQAEPIEVILKSSSGLKNYTFEVLDGPGELQTGNKLKLTGVGVVKLVLSEPGDARYAAALVQKLVTVTKAEQTITFEDLAADIEFRAAAIELNSTSTSGLEVGYEVVSEHATRGVEWSLSSSEIVGGKLMLPQLGILPQTVTVKAVQSGDGFYNAASEVEQTFVLSRGQDVLSFDTIGDRLLVGSEIALNATSSSGKSPKYAIVDGPAMVPSSALGSLYLLGAEGTVTVRASTVGNKYYLPADSTQSFEVKLKGWIALETMSGGTVELSPDQDLYEPETEVSLTPKPASGYEFEGWSGELSGSDNPKSVIVSAPMSVGATFKDVQGPVVSMTGPTAGATSDVGYTLSGSVSDNRGVNAASWTLGGVDQGALTLDSSGGFSVTGLNLGYGSNVIVVKALDEGGNEGSGTVTVSWEPKRTLRIGTVIERQEGQKMEVPIELKSAGDVSSMTFVLKYDPKYLTEPNLVWSSEMLGVLNSVNTSTVGELRCAFSLGGSKVVSSGEKLVSKVEFRVRSIPEELGSEVSLEVLEMADNQGNSLAASRTASVNGQAQLLKRRVIGDNNGNDRLDVGDGTVILKMLTGLEEVRTWDVGSNDLNENTKLDSGDVTRVLKSSVRLVGKSGGGTTGGGGGTPVVKKVAPRFLLHPRSRVMTQGQTYVFRAQATGTQPIRYQWYRNGQLLPGRRSSVLVKSRLKSSDSGTYWVLAQNEVRTVRSGGARLTVRGISGGGRSITKMGGDGAPLEQAILSLKEKSGNKVRVTVNLSGLKSNLSGTTLELSYPKDVLKLANEASHRAGTMVPELMKNTVYWNVMPENDYETQDGRLVFGLGSAGQWAKADGQLAELEFEVLNASGLAAAELKLTNVEFTPDGFQTRPVAGSRLIVGTGAQKPVGSDYGKADGEVLYEVSANGDSDYVFDGGGFEAENDPELVLVEGMTYVFELQGSGHPFYVGTADGFDNEFGGMEVEGNGLDGTGKRVILMPSADTPRTLSYYCSLHSEMVGQISVVKASDGDVDEGISIPREGVGEEIVVEDATQVTVTLSGLSQTHDGSEKEVSVTTDPSGLSVVVTYDGASTKPIAVGDYVVVATVTTANYEGSASGTLSISAAAGSGGGTDTGGTTDTSGSADSGVTTTTEEAFGDVVVYANNSATLIGQVTIDGEVAGKGDVVAIYVGSELRGKHEVIDPAVGGGVAWVNAQVNAKGGEETISFKVWDASTGVTRDKSGTSAVITTGGAVGSSTSPLMIEMKDSETQTLSLKAGWNLVSFYVEASDMTAATVLAPISSSLLQIKNLTSSYDPSIPSFLNTLSSLSVKDGYWLKVSSDVSLDVDGTVPSGASISVKSGWNLVGYPRSSGESAAGELTSLGSTVVQIKNLTSSYDPSIPSFLNTLSTMVPGSGYWLKVTADGTWTVGTVSESGSGRGLGKMGPVQKMGWGSVMVYPHVSATVLSEVSVGGKPVSKGSVVGAFVGEELRGEHEVVLANGKSYGTLNVNLTGKERVTFRIREAASGKEYRVAKVMELGLGETYGRAEELVKLNAVMTGTGVTILSYTRSPFGLSFDTGKDKNYVVEATGDLLKWNQVETIQGTGSAVQFTDSRKALFEKQYYRVKTKQ